jgi:hypothetical protein
MRSLIRVPSSDIILRKFPTRACPTDILIPSRGVFFFSTDTAGTALF